MRYKDLAALGAVLALFASACKSSSPTAPPMPNTSGTWTGTVNDALMGQGTVRLTITQSDSTIAGTWATTYATVTNNNGGSLTGSVNTSSVTGIISVSKQ